MTGSFSPVVDVNLWFSKDAQCQIGGLVTAIEQEHDADIRRFMSVCLSSCVRKVSYADPRLSVPVRKKNNPKKSTPQLNTTVCDYFVKSVTENARRVSDLDVVNSDLLSTLTLLKTRVQTPSSLPKSKILT